MLNIKQKAKSASYNSPEITADCPVTNQQLRINIWEYFKVPGGQATWWKCPSCHGWHALVVDAQLNPKPMIH